MNLRWSLMCAYFPPEEVSRQRVVSRGAERSCGRARPSSSVWVPEGGGGFCRWIHGEGCRPWTHPRGEGTYLCSSGPPRNLAQNKKCCRASSSSYNSLQGWRRLWWGRRKVCTWRRCGGFMLPSALGRAVQHVPLQSKHKCAMWVCAPLRNERFCF